MEQGAFQYVFSRFYYIFVQKEEHGTFRALLSVLNDNLLRKLDLITADLNRLQHRDIDRLIKIAAIARGVFRLVLRISDKAAACVDMDFESGSPYSIHPSHH